MSVHIAVRMLSMMLLKVKMVVTGICILLVLSVVRLGKRV